MSENSIPVTQLKITQLTIYPVKSMKGIALESALLTSSGLNHDRRFMVVQSNGRFVTQRDNSRLALIQTELDADGLLLARPGFGSITIPMDQTGGSPISSKVWKDRCETVDRGEEVSQWLTGTLESEEPLRLVSMDPGFKRSLSKAVFLGTDTSTYFADAAPYLVANESSLQKLNTELVADGADAVPMNRFRPNIVVSGLKPFAEHNVIQVTGPDLALGFCYPCERCVVTTINQDTGQRDSRKQPFRTLARINPMPENPRAPAFAENAVLKSGEGQVIRVGDLLRAEFG